MFEILLAVCLEAELAVCADRLAPPALATEAECVAAGPDRAVDWMAAHDGLRVAGWRCVDRTALAAPVPPLAVTEVAEGVFVHRGRLEVPTPENAGDLANLGFVVGDDAVAVIDAGGSRGVGERLYSTIRRHTDLPIRWLILTHMHPDHVLGASVFREAGARVIGHAKLGDALANRAETYAANVSRRIGAAAFIGTTVILPDEGVETREIDLGGRILEIDSHLTAHTDNDLTVLDRKTGTWFTGDLVFAVHTPALDGSILGWQAALEAMAATGAARIVPGHGPISLPWPEGAEATRGYLAALTAETRAAIAAGESMRTAIEHLGESQRHGWRLFDEFNPRNATAAYKELEWE